MCEYPTLMLRRNTRSSIDSCKQPNNNHEGSAGYGIRVQVLSPTLSAIFIPVGRNGKEQVYKSPGFSKAALQYKIIYYYCLTASRGPNGGCIQRMQFNGIGTGTPERFVFVNAASSGGSSGGKSRPVLCPRRCGGAPRRRRASF
mgnify:CR=1 FL=1